ncbi:MAG: hypothetical protein JRH18_05065 [Deltaproteobacteria bacterium]|nr:hypothetical protein [Deltaproteobacteria bacterium]MBW1993465.1 hypothetical protein [Deltaproteobacteria bacterium]MBW2151016.1 hypothetical protein [Deltaproteobacteria bacterium]
MSIRLIAKELYSLYRKVEKLEKEIENACGERRVELENQPRKVRAERDRVRRILEASKSSR